MLEVFLPSAAVDQNVIKENQQMLSELLAKRMVHTELKCGWGVG
jgi:hypothetical protein